MQTIRWVILAIADPSAADNNSASFEKHRIWLNLISTGGTFSQNIYIEDKLLNIIHDLKVSPYVFTSAVGTFNDRFVLRFNDPLLHTNQFDNNPSLVAFINDHQLYVESSHNIRNIAIYDVSGKWVKTFTPHQKRTFKGQDFAKVKLENGLILTRKLAN